jgi:polyhydroxybutyrate depolymerase
MRNAARGLAIHPHWPEAVCIYAQGLNTPGALTDPEGKKPGWQKGPGDQSDRDLKLFDAMLAWAIKEHGIDAKRVFSTGHSNGGGFTYCLWTARGDKLAAIAPSAAGGARFKDQWKPIPFMALGSENDPLVKWATVQKPAIDAAKKLNGVNATGKPWHDVKNATIYESKTGTPVVVLMHDGEHKFAADGMKHVVRFFKEIAEKINSQVFSDRKPRLN